MWKPIMKLNRMKLRYRIFFCVIVVLLVGLLGEIVFNLPLLMGREESYKVIDLSEVDSPGFKYENGILHTDGSIRPDDGEKKSVTFKIDRQYVGKLRYQYQGSNQVRANILVNYFTGYDRNNPNASGYVKTVTDNNIIFAKESVENIKMTTNKITLQFPDLDTITEGGMNLDISGIEIDNQFVFSPVRMLFVCIAVFLFLFIICFADTIVHHMERAFVVCCACMGLILVISLPEHKVGWDEEIHFYRAYAVSEKIALHDEAIVYPAITQLMDVASENWPYDIPRSMEEHNAEIKYLNSNGIYSENQLNHNEDIPSEYIQKLSAEGIQMFGYLPQAFFLMLAKMLHLPFALVYLAGRMGNLVIYCLIMYFAIKKIPIGKGILTGISLLPTLMFLTGVYAYDITVYALISLSISYLLDEFLNPDRKIKYTSFAVICLSMVLGCASKAVYIPLILITLFLPGNKFRSVKERNICKGIVIFSFLAMMSTFVLPTVLKDNIEGDVRGIGKTSVSEQLHLIFSHPLTYAKVLLNSIKINANSYIFGSDTLSNMGHFGIAPFPNFTIIYAVFLMLTDLPKNSKQRLSGKTKTVIAVMIFVTLCLIWTALYLDFTGVGEPGIYGVQGRYYLPFLPLLYLVIQTYKVESHISERVYNRLVLGTSSFVTMASIYTILITKYV